MFKPSRSVTLLQTWLIFVIAVGVGLVFGIAQLAREYDQQLVDIRKTSNAVIDSVEGAASQAAFTYDRYLASGVADGLLRFVPIVTVEIFDEFGNSLVSSSSKKSNYKENWTANFLPIEVTSISAPLHHALEPDKVIGTLVVEVSSEQAAMYVLRQAGYEILFALGRALILAIILLFIFNRLFTRPLVKMANEFSRIDPDDPKKGLLPDANSYPANEFRAVVESVNKLLGSVSSHIQARAKAAVALKESEQRFRSFAEIASDWLWEMDSDFRFTYFSPRAGEVLGINVAHAIGKSRYDLTSEMMDRPKWQQHMNDLENHRPFRNFAYDIHGPSGGPRTISLNGDPVFDENGNFTGFRGTGRDVTPEKESARALDAALRRAEEANQAKSEFLATMSHEFRTPLNAILGFSEMLKGQYFGPLGGEKYLEYADAIRSSGGHMLGLVDQVLDISAIEAGKRTYEFRAVDVREILDFAENDFQKAISDKGVALVINAAPDLPKVRADARSARQVMNNMLSNAVKFTETGGSITVTATERDGFVSIQVADTGVGIPANRLPFIAEPFSRGLTDAYVAQEGAGLGLSIVKSLMSDHDGEMQIESEVGKGTTVTVFFPIASAEINEDDAGDET
ncbi:PAS domain-containing sensor histidine kinase [Hwanghaeella grinnelliae]|uniref:histidine kinase n=1 Tax=Hwanghaeella grinnelliae TaxID=2500179 RepID=A0A3S2VTJ6_9PROT|nr:PAS domain-containing sensor histidine kinase [Hwanghaeella grinnelliae]RVU39470.1 PAS domain-containing sensor histidine kinase [Hwanghaeella grinnelliae]